ncbi:chloride channel protein [Pseudonocardia nematodicida]|uniref:Chloride channel protein n=1 Tax=Pseudonocardia nematodicida TaxID=1206997 RepID=A0ABV1K6T7_9PSEU
MTAAGPGATGIAYLRLVGLGALIGIPAALVAALFLAAAHAVERLLWDDLPALLGQDSPPWYLVVGLPLAGAAVTLAARRLLPGGGGESPLDGLSATPVPPSYAPGIALAALGALAFGAVLGPEMPLIALGSTVGTSVAALVRTAPAGRGVLGTAGSFSAISALFGGPLVAGMLLVEGGLAAGAALLPTLLPGLVAAAVGYLLFTGLGDWGGLDRTALSVPGLPDYGGVHLLDLLVAIVVGVLTGLLVNGIRLAAARLAGRAGAGTATGTGALLAAGLVTGLLALLAGALGAEPRDVLFSGQAAMPGLVAETSIGVVLVVLVAKGIGYTLCLGGGFRGGPIFPAIFLGIALAMPAVIGLGVSPTLAVAVGTAAGMAASTGLLISPVLFAALLVGYAGHDVVPAAVLAATAAWLTRAALNGRAGSDAARS